MPAYCAGLRGSTGAGAGEQRGGGGGAQTPGNASEHGAGASTDVRWSSTSSCGFVDSVMSGSWRAMSSTASVRSVLGGKGGGSAAATVSQRQRSTAAQAVFSSCRAQGAAHRPARYTVLAQSAQRRRGEGRREKGREGRASTHGTNKPFAEVEEVDGLGAVFSGLAVLEDDAWGVWTEGEGGRENGRTRARVRSGRERRRVGQRQGAQWALRQEERPLSSPGGKYLRRKRLRRIGTGGGGRGAGEGERDAKRWREGRKPKQRQRGKGRERASAGGVMIGR